MKRLSLLSVVTVAGIVACSSADTTTPTSTGATVTLQATSFEPATITVKVGDTVTWKWAEGTHDVESGANCTEDGKFSSGEPVAGGSFEQKFDTAGTFDYFCSVHCKGGMTGKVIVQ